MNELPIIQKTYDLIKWYIPHLNNLPRSHKYVLGDMMAKELYEILSLLITARYSNSKLCELRQVNTLLEILRYQTRLLFDLNLTIDARRLEFVSNSFNDIGNDLGDRKSVV